MEEKNTTPIWKKIVSILLCVILIPVIIINIVLIFDGFNNKNDMPSAFGYRPMIVLSGSMSPVFEAGDMILIKDEMCIRDRLCSDEKCSSKIHSNRKKRYQGFRFSIETLDRGSKANICLACFCWLYCPFDYSVHRTHRRYLHDRRLDVYKRQHQHIWKKYGT